MTMRQVLSDRTKISLQYIAAVMAAFAGLALLLANPRPLRRHDLSRRAAGPRKSVVRTRWARPEAD